MIQSIIKSKTIHLTVSNSYTTALARWLVGNGYKVEVSTFHPDKVRHIGERPERDALYFLVYDNCKLLFNDLPIGENYSYIGKGFLPYTDSICIDPKGMYADGTYMETELDKEDIENRIKLASSYIFPTVLDKFRGGEICYKNKAKYVLFLMQQPESPRLMWQADEWAKNQKELIKKVYDSLPHAHTLVIKQDAQGSAINYASDDKIVLVPPFEFDNDYITTMDLIKNAEVVVSVNHPMLFEAIKMHKPCIVFGRDAYTNRGVVKEYYSDFPEVLFEGFGINERNADILIYELVCKRQITLQQLNNPSDIESWWDWYLIQYEESIKKRL